MIFAYTLWSVCDPSPYSPRGFHRARARRIGRSILKIILWYEIFEFINICFFFKKAGARNSRGAPALVPILLKKLFSFCLLSCWLLENVMHGFSFSKRASAPKYACPRWLFYKFVFHHLFPSPFIHYCFFEGTKAGAWALRKTAPAVMECFQCVLPQIISLIAPPRVATPRDILAAALDKKVFHFNHLSFPIVQFKRSIFMDFFWKIKDKESWQVW